MVVPEIPPDPRTPRSRGPRRRPSAYEAASALAATAALPDHDHRQPEGRRRQDHHRGEPGRQPGPARLACPGDRPRPAGERVDRAGRRAPRRRPLRLRRAGRRPPAGRGGAAGRGDARPVLRARHHRPGRRRDRTGPGGGQGTAAGPGAEGLRHVGPRLRAGRLPAVARPAHAERAGGAPRRCCCRSSASTTRSRASSSC